MSAPGRLTGVCPLATTTLLGQPRCAGQGRLESHSTLCASLGSGAWYTTHTVSGGLGKEELSHHCFSFQLGPRLLFIGHMAFLAFVAAMIGQSGVSCYHGLQSYFSVPDECLGLEGWWDPLVLTVSLPLTPASKRWCFPRTHAVQG